MNQADEELAADLLQRAATSGERLAELPAASRPASVDEAHAIQARLVERSGKAVAGWKVSTSAAGEVMHGAIYADDCHVSPAVVARGRYPLMGIEAEIAFRFTRDLPARERPYARGELAACVVPLAVFEIVDSRFASYADTAPIVRLADRMSNGAMVLGDEAAGADPTGLNAVRVRLAVDGRTVVEQAGGHMRTDPFLPAVEFVNARQRTNGFRAGQFVTTGTFTGLRFAQAGEVYEATFEGIGSVRATIA